ncbi:uncharacterized protein LOC127844960 [Dreissena polymorpha]|uniref:uncharacterized protein LOC127844960 n=1 Tax=Dreissena polymorpha TaxID=45954 RepID=UPI0022652F31|nr:uncharacterized protein LOC127844960 [Dreissena polymorpha]XP_052231513.1 uncharacterized protein LOC127844960 [Dreissena polymorpha]
MITELIWNGTRVQYLTMSSTTTFQQSTGVIGSFNPVLAGDSMPTMASMSQPVQSATTNGMQVQEAKFYKGDQQDSVIDVSNHPNSDGSSTRSSPHMENQAGENQWEGNIRGLLGG